MNILIPHSWLAKYLKTNAKPKAIAESLSLCGPSVERVLKVNKDHVYDIEVTTNRVDMMSVYGIAREAATILPEFGYKTHLLPLKLNKIKNRNELGIKITNNPKLCKRILAIKLENVKLGDSPSWIQEPLIKVGQRPLNNVIDITNYIMWELGHPIHAFDYDRITSKQIIVREAKRGEKLITLDNTTYILNGGEVVFDNGKGEIIDLPGVVGTANTAVTKNTKNVLLWVESVDSKRIRHASMGLNIRTQAAVLNEKHVDPELGLNTILKAVELYKDITKAKVTSKLVDINEAPYKTQVVVTTHRFIESRLGTNIPKTKIQKVLNSLEFGVSWHKDTLKVNIPSFRSYDVSIPEDIVEEVARIYGYHKLPSKLMDGLIPTKDYDPLIQFESEIKNIIKGLGGIEIYTFSLVPEKWIGKSALKLLNPLGADSEYLRTNLMHSLVDATYKNAGETGPYHLFEIANIYLPRNGRLPEEKMNLAGIFANSDYRFAKGAIEALLNELNILIELKEKDASYFMPGRRIEFYSKNTYLGQLGVLEKGTRIYYEFYLEALMKNSSPIIKFQPLPKYPPQIEDITLVLPRRTRVGAIMSTIYSTSKLIKIVELTDTYNDSYTFRINYQHPKKTLTDSEVKKIRNLIISIMARKFGASTK